MGAVDYSALVNVIVKIIGGGWPIWIMTGIVGIAVTYLLWKLNSLIKKMIYKQSQEDIPVTEDDVKKEDGKVEDDWHKAEDNTKKVITEEPVEPPKPHRPVPAQTEDL